MSKDWHTAPVLDAALPRWRRLPPVLSTSRNRQDSRAALALQQVCWRSHARRPGRTWTDPDRCRTCAHRRRTARLDFRGIRFNSVNAIRGAAVKSRARPHDFFGDGARSRYRRDACGRIVAGRYTGASLDTLEFSTLIALEPEFDQESRALLAAYLDRRDPRWREHAQAGATAGQRAAANSSKMTEKEAYQVPWP